MLILIEAGNEVVGLEISEAAVETCRSLGLNAFVYDIESGSIEDLFKYGIFDVVILEDVLKHLIDPLCVLREKIIRILRPGGRCIATVPNFVFLPYRLAFMSGHIPHFGNDDAEGHDPPRPYNLRHKTLFNRNNLYITFTLARFRRVEVSPETISPSLRKAWRVPGLRRIRVFAKRLWPNLLAARFLVIAWR